MVERGRGGRAQTWPDIEAASGRRTAGYATGTGWLDRLAERLRAWSASDVAPGRLVPWLAIAFGFGIILYFTAHTEPTWWAVLPVTLAGVASCVAARARPFAFPFLLGLTAVALGFLTGTARNLVIGHPVLDYPAFGVEISGFVEVREDRERSDRIVIRIHKMEAPRLSAKPDRVRLSVRKVLHRRPAHS